jgi:hypothetical protein
LGKIFQITVNLGDILYSFVIGVDMIYYIDGRKLIAVQADFTARWWSDCNFRDSIFDTDST